MATFEIDRGNYGEATVDADYFEEKGSLIIFFTTPDDGPDRQVYAVQTSRVDFITRKPDAK